MYLHIIVSTYISSSHNETRYEIQYPHDPDTNLVDKILLQELSNQFQYRLQRSSRSKILHPVYPGHPSILPRKKNRIGSFKGSHL